MSGIDIILNKFKSNIKSYTMIIALVTIWIIFAIFTNGVFLKPQNISNLFRQMTIISFLAIGMVFVIVTGNIDLSVGSVCGFVSALAAKIQVDYFPDYILPQLLKLFPTLTAPVLGMISTIFTIGVCVIISLLIGVYQGFVTAYMKVPAFIVTLGGMMIFRGGVLGVTNGETVTPIEQSLRDLGQAYFPATWGWVLAVITIIILFVVSLLSRGQKQKYGFTVKPLYVDLLKMSFFSVLILFYVFIVNLYQGLQFPVFVMCLVALVFSYLSTNTRFGRYSYAIGGNKEATRLSGVNIKWTIFKVMVLMALLSGVAGVVLTGYVAAGTIGGGKDYELSAIASCVIGGTSLMGGEGTIFGALVGALVMASLENGMSVLNMAPFWQYVIKGLVLILAVFIDISTKKKTA